MYSLHITEHALTDICAGKYENWNFIAQKQNTIIVDSKADSPIYIDDENLVFIFSRMYDIEFKSDLNKFQDIYVDSSKVIETPCGAYILDIDDNKAKNIEADYGVICQSAKNINEDYVNYHNPADCFDGDTNHSWKSILGDVTNHTTNTIIINDRYLFAKDKIDPKTGTRDTIGIDNCINIIDSILPKKCAGDYHILVAFDKNETIDGMSFAKISTELNKRIKSLRAYSMKLEVLAYNRDCYNYQHTHNRRVVTNYHLIIAEHRYTAFMNNKKSSVDQRITCDMLYFHSGPCDKSDLPVITHKNFIKRFSDIIAYCKSNSHSGYEYACNGNSKVEFKDFQNRLLQ